MHYHQAVEYLTPYVVKIRTPRAEGTGFLCFYNQDQSVMGIATAYHVVNDAEDWGHPIKIVHGPSSTVAAVDVSSRAILGDPHSDSAIVLLRSDALPLPRQEPQLIPPGKVLLIGAEIGWLGFPSVNPDMLCFFSGNVSAIEAQTSSYLLDGVSIHGVSGGPVFAAQPDVAPMIIGTVSAYRVNRSTGEALPGLAVARDVTHFHGVIKHFRNLGEAQQQAQEDSAQREQSPGDGQAPPESGSATRLQT